MVIIREIERLQLVFSDGLPTCSSRLDYIVTQKKILCREASSAFHHVSHDIQEYRDSNSLKGV